MSALGLAGPVTGQGGGGAALASALNLDKGVDTYFQGSKDEECYGRIRLQPLCFVDDIMRGLKDVNCLRAGCLKLDYVIREKQLEAHPTRSGFLVTGSEVFKAKVQHELKAEPLMLGKIVMKEKMTESYLDKLSSEDIKSSVEETIREISETRRGRPR